MKHSPPRHSRNAKQEWMSALFTLLVLSGIYGSMDSFSSFENSSQPTISLEGSGTISSVAPPYWNRSLNYGFRSLAGDIYTSSGNHTTDTVVVSPSGTSPPTHKEIRVSFYRDASIDDIEKSLFSDIPHKYSRLSHGIAVIHGDIDSPSAKTIYSTLHSR